MTDMFKNCAVSPYVYCSSLLYFFCDFNQQTVLLFHALNFQGDAKVVMIHSGLSDNCNYCDNKVGVLFSGKLCPGLFLQFSVCF